LINSGNNALLICEWW